MIQIQFRYLRLIHSFFSGMLVQLDFQFERSEFQLRILTFSLLEFFFEVLVLVDFIGFGFLFGLEFFSVVDIYKPFIRLLHLLFRQIFIDFLT